MPTAALAMKSVACWHHLFKLNKDRSGHSGTVEMLHVQASLGHECALRTTLPRMGVLPYHGELLTECASHVHLANTLHRWRATQSSRDASAFPVMGVCCVLQCCGRTHFRLKLWGTVSSEKLCTAYCALHTKHPG